MKTTKLILILSIISLLLFSGCATVGGTRAIVEGGNISKAQMIPTEIPMPIKTIEIYDKTKNERIEADVLSLSSSEIRKRLTSTETFISVEKRDSSGSLTYMGAGGKVSRGTYRVTFDYVNYTNQSILFDDTTKESAIGRIGVGLRITAELVTTSNGVDLSGLIPIGLAAQDNKVSGHLKFKVYGISNDKVGLAVPTTSILDVSSIQKSFEAASAVRILFGLDETTIEPYLIGVADIKPVDAERATEAAVKKLVE
ncbi:MAG: hypothetical protein K9L30_15800 [Desulfobacterales bacterium]|nr:hypothetical protein [Desulfobacterales bacterium]